MDKGGFMSPVNKGRANVVARANRSHWLVSAAVAAALGGSTFGSIAVAQNVEVEADALEEVTVTGSRIVRRDLTAPSPIVTVTAETFQNTAATSMEATLNKLPAFKPAGNQFLSGAQAGPTTTPGAATLNLRGLGANRNLVLIDGRRPQPANAALVVDINTIPQAAIQGVEVITGGASAVYGPDAIAGVTNFLLRRDFQGLDVDVQTGITEQGDGQETRVGILMGMNAADGRGNIMVGLDYVKRDAVLQRDRDFFVNGWQDQNNAGGDFIQRAGFVNLTPGNNPSAAAVSAVLGTPLSGTGSVSNGSIFYFNPDGSAYVAQGAIGYTGPFNQLSSGQFNARITSRDDMVTQQTSGLLDQRYTTQFLSTPSERHSLFLRGTYDITENLSAFVQANYSNSEVITRGNFAPAVTLWSVSIPRDGRALPAELNTLLDSRPNPTANWQLYQVLNYFGALEATNTTNLWQLMAGLRGNVGISDWTWEAYFARGETKTDSEIPMPSLQRYQAIAAAPNFGRGLTNFAGTASPLGRGYSLNCTSGLPVFEDFELSADCRQSMEIRGKQLTNLEQDVFEANMQGRAFDLPAGEARFAAGVAYRKNEFRFDPSYPVEMIYDNPIGLFASNKTQGETNVKEIYGELLAPIIGGLELELGYRFSDFNTAGGESTWKALFTWRAVDSLTFRGGYQFATRAPNTAELFAGNRLEVVTFPGVDPCSAATDHLWGNRAENPNRVQVQAVCRAIVNKSRGLPATDMTSLYDTQTFNTNVTVNGRLMGPGVNGFTRQNPPYFPLEIEIEKGNPNLDPESAQTWTLGAVVSEPFGWSGLTVTADFYQIEITDQIARLSSFAAYYNCLNANGSSNASYDPNNEYCLLIGRNGNTGDREQTDSLYLNLGDLETQGIDFTLGWVNDFGPGTFSFNTSVNYLLKYEYQPFTGAPFNDAKGTLDQGGQFDYTVLTDFGYRWDAFSVGLEWRYLPSVDSVDKALLGETTVVGADSYSVFNLRGGWDLGKVKLRAGIDNLFDTDPNIVGANPGIDTNSNQTNLSYYDGLGRRYYVGAQVSF
jgi:outer membrane receptor protein involved in Fe transport